MHVYQYIKYECLCTVYMMGVCACNTYLLSMLLCNAYTSVCVCVHMKVHLIFKQMFREYTCTTKCNTLSGDPYLVGDQNHTQNFVPISQVSRSWVPSLSIQTHISVHHICPLLIYSSKDAAAIGKCQENCTSYFNVLNETDTSNLINAQYSYENVIFTLNNKF